MTDPIALYHRGEFAAAAKTLLPLYKQNLRNSLLALYTGAALMKAARRDEALAVWSLGDEAGPAVRNARNDPNAPPDIRQLSIDADTALRAHLAALHLRAVDELGLDKTARVQNAVWTQTHDKPFSFLTDKQAPTIFYMPELPATPITASESLAWTSVLEEAVEDVRAEYADAVRRNLEQTPYVPAQTPSPQWAKLRGTLNWSSLHLFGKAKRTALADAFPKTLKILESVDLVRIDGVPLEVFFSRLKPGAHIPPHYGLTNARLTVHLPLIVPDDCAIRVADEDYRWREGKIIAFDDSYLHEAWNRSDRDRVVLIFECHHPDLSPTERHAVEHSWTVRQRWIEGRLKTIGVV